MRDDYIKHYNVKGTNWYVHKFGNWERHAKYANGQPNPETTGINIPQNVTKKDIAKRIDDVVKYGSVNKNNKDSAIKYFGQKFAEMSSDVKDKVLNIDKATGFRKKYIEATREQDMAKVNPLFNTKLPDTSKNCIYCTAAYEMRRRGYDVQAKENKVDSEGVYPEVLTDCFPNSKIVKVANAEEILGNKGKISSYAYGTGIYNPVVGKTIKALKDQGDGARGTLLVLWKEGWGGHALSYDVNNGSVNILDSQSNKLYDNPIEVRRVLNDCSDTRYVRLDKVDFDPEKIKGAVR